MMEVIAAQAAPIIVMFAVFLVSDRFLAALASVADFARRILR